VGFELAPWTFHTTYSLTCLLHDVCTLWNKSYVFIRILFKTQTKTYYFCLWSNRCWKKCTLRNWLWHVIQCRTTYLTMNDLLEMVNKKWCKKNKSNQSMHFGVIIENTLTKYSCQLLNCLELVHRKRQRVVNVEN